MAKNQTDTVLSVIVAAYNIESTIDRIFDHILQCKHLDQIEVIVVNDGSKDKTQERAESYVRQYPDWVSVIDKPNGGHGSALSAGFKVARGKYCRPLDGDDWLDSTGLDSLIEVLQSSTADMVVSDVETLNIDTQKSHITPSPLTPHQPQTVQDIVSIEPMPGYHATVFATSILKNIPELDHHCFYVDNEYNTYPLFEVKEVYYIPGVVYVHTVGNEEQSTSLQSLMRNESNLRTVFFSLMRYAAQHPNNKAAVAVTHRFALSLLGIFTRVAFELNPKEGNAKLHQFYAQVEREYPQFYAQSALPTSGNLYRKFGLRGYNLIRMIMRLRNRNSQRGVIW